MGVIPYIRSEKAPGVCIVNILETIDLLTSMVSCQKGPTRHAYAWQIGPFWQDTLDM